MSYTLKTKAGNLNYNDKVTEGDLEALRYKL